MLSPRLASAPHYTPHKFCIFALYLVVAAIPACAQVEGKDYFPLAVGSEWSYKGRFSSEGSKPVALRGAARVSGKALIRGKEYYRYTITSKFSEVSKAHRPFEDVRYYRVDRGSVFILSGNDGDGPELLEIPFPLRGGLKWSSGTAEALAEHAGTMKLGGRTYSSCMKITYRAPDGARRTEYYLAPGVGVIRAIYMDSTAPESVLELTLEEYKR